MLALDVTAFAAWSIGGRLIFSGPKAREIEALAAGELIVYAVVVFVVDQRYWIAIANDAPAVIFLGISLLVAYRRTPGGPALWGLVGLALIFVAGHHFVTATAAPTWRPARRPGGETPQWIGPVDVAAFLARPSGEGRLT